MGVYNYDYVPEGGGTRCDFCANAHVTWSYPAKSFTMEDGTESAGAWLACDKCHDLIEQGNWRFLAHWSVDAYTENASPVGISQALRNEMEQELLPKVINLHKKFMKMRDGDATPYQEISPG